MSNILIFGLGKSGISACKLLLKGNNVFLFDNNTVMNDEIQHLLNLGAVLVGTCDIDFIITTIDKVVLSPGVSIYNPVVERLRQSGAEIVGEMELGFVHCQSKIVAVTGTNGKTTTSSLIHKILAESGAKCRLLGNIGVPLCDEVLQIDKDEMCIVETSSFQLETIDTFHPCVAVLTNITPDHIDRHLNFQNYIFTKARIFENQNENDFAVLNADDKNVQSLKKCIKAKVLEFSTQKKVVGAYKKGDMLLSFDGNVETEIMNLNDAQIKGTHNIENLLATIAVCLTLDIDPIYIRNGIKKFSPIRHRMQPVGTINGVTFVNDSKATNVFSVLPVLNAYENVCLILGGSDKDSNFDPLFENMSENIKYCVFFGQTKSKLSESAKKFGYKNYFFGNSLEDSMKIAFACARATWVVLLSPACASFDMFQNFEDRGNKFESIFKEMKNESEK